MRDKRKAYEEKLDAQLKEWSAQIALLKAKADNAKAYAKVAVKASACTQCGSCEERCSQGIAIPDVLEMAAKLFGE